MHLILYAPHVLIKLRHFRFLNGNLMHSTCKQASSHDWKAVVFLQTWMWRCGPDHMWTLVIIMVPMNQSSHGTGQFPTSTIVLTSCRAVQGGHLDQDRVLHRVGVRLHYIRVTCTSRWATTPQLTHSVTHKQPHHCRSWLNVWRILKVHHDQQTWCAVLA